VPESETTRAVVCDDVCCLFDEYSTTKQTWLLEDVVCNHTQKVPCRRKIDVGASRTVALPVRINQRNLGWSIAMTRHAVPVMLQLLF
jgi:hypothetical protein